MPWRVYRPAVVVGNSETGEMDKVDGPYYFFKLIQQLRHYVPEWVPLAGADLGGRTSCPSTTSRRRWTTSPTSPAWTGRPSI